MTEVVKVRQDATRAWSTHEVRWWAACYIKAGNSEDVKFARIKEIFDEGTRLTEQIATMVVEAWPVLLEDGVWKVRISLGVGMKYWFLYGQMLTEQRRLPSVQKLKPLRSW